jgi:hypothetical protein
MACLLADIDWNTLLQSPDTLVTLVVPIMTVLVILGVTIAIQWRRVQQAKYDAELKLRMIDRGFTAEEIKTVIGTSTGRRTRRIGTCGVDLRASCKPAGEPSAKPVNDSAGCC